LRDDRQTTINGPVRQFQFTEVPEILGVGGDERRLWLCAMAAI